jgi:coenzyme F420 hydrogenase subunit beta
VIASRQIQNIQDVVDWGQCIGCGACHYACHKGGVTLVNVLDQGIRPVFSGDCGQCTSCLSICPGHYVDGNMAARANLDESIMDTDVGPVLEIWEGYASDSEIRFRGSSGGMLSALSLYCLEKEGMDFVLHTGMDEEKPWQNKTRTSRTRNEVLSCTGSRYAPASPCDSLELIEKAEKPCVFIGKPCDASAVALLRQTRPDLDQRLGLVLTFFCAGTPSTQGTMTLLDQLGTKRSETKSLRYRGEGWPGLLKVFRTDDSLAGSLTYQQSWGRLTKFTPFRCRVCPDGVGRVADISCGDAWHRHGSEDDPGRSLVLVRTRRGREILQRAVASGYVHLMPSGLAEVKKAQTNLLAKRREIYGRLTALRLLGIPAPQFVNFSLFSSWIKLSPSLIVKTIFGTLRRLWRAKAWRRRQINPIAEYPQHNQPSKEVELTSNSKSSGVEGSPGLGLAGE